MILVALDDDCSRPCGERAASGRRETLSPNGATASPISTAGKASDPTLNDATVQITAPGRLPRISGTIRYERRLNLKGSCQIDLGEVYEAVQVLV